MPRKGRHRLDEAPDLEQPSRPIKRQRNDDSTAIHELTEARSARSAVQAPPSRRRHSPASSHDSWKVERNGLPRQHGEFRDVEDNVKVQRNHHPIRSPHLTRRRPIPSEFARNETFTTQAAKQRRAGVEITADGLSNREAVPKIKPKASQRLANSRESPDELQGGVTTLSLPRYVNGKPKQTRQNLNKELSPSPARKRSPSDIRPTDFTSSPIQGPKRAKRSHKSTRKAFRVSSLRFGIHKKQTTGQDMVFHIDEEKIELVDFVADFHGNVEIPLCHIIMTVRGDENSRKVRLRLTKKADSPGDRLDIDFASSSEKDRFTNFIQEQDHDIKMQDRSSVFMDNAFDRYEIELEQFSSTPKKPLIDTLPAEPVQESSTSSTRQRLSSALQGDERVSEAKTDPIKRGNRSNSKSLEGADETRDKTTAPLKERDIADDDSKANRPVESEKEGESEVEIPVKKYQQKPGPERQTRSTGRRSTRLSDIFENRDDDTVDPSSKFPLKHDPFRNEWKQPLIYPQNGKKKAEVTVEDRDRLRDDEFLNDNLIAFYMRFLQDHLERTNKEAAKEVYFFNSYFYDTLTKTPRGERGINYSGVAKWTRNVDLFSYNYVVVPINQSAHWYVAIICNLPKLLGETETGGASQIEAAVTVSNDKDSSNQPDSEVHEILESPEPEPVPLAPNPAESNPDANRAERISESPAAKSTRHHLASMSLDKSEPEGTKTTSRKQEQERSKSEKHTSGIDPTIEDSKEPTSADEWPAEDEHHPSPVKTTTASFGVKAVEPKTDSIPASQGSTSKKKGKAGHKLDPDQTTIITFDSLDLARSPTIRMLREYICEESISKRRKTVDPKDIKGMRARQIPLQPNFSDCGLYLLAYLEKFAQDPDQFITKLLQREMDGHADWPPLGSGLLRQRLRDFLDQLYQEQERVKGGKSGKHKILADQQPVSHLLGPSPSSRDDTRETIEGAPKKAEDVSENKDMTERLPSESRDSQAESEPDDSSTVDQLQLVPTGTAPVISNEPLMSSATKDASDNRSSPKKDEDIVEVPDSQEQQPASSSSRPEARPTKSEKKKPSKGEPAPKAKRSDRKQTTTDEEVIHLGDSHTNKPTKKSAPKFEVQVRETPPPPSPGKVRKSPRGGKQKP